MEYNLRHSHNNAMEDQTIEFDKLSVDVKEASLPVLYSGIFFVVLTLLIVFIYSRLNKRHENYCLNLRAMINDGEIHGIGNKSNANSLHAITPTEFLTENLIPLVENREITESALRFVKQKWDPRCSLDPKKINKRAETGAYAPFKLRGKTPRIKVDNQNYVEVKSTTKPQLKKDARDDRKSNDNEEHSEDFSKGPPILDMYVDEDNSCDFLDSLNMNESNKDVISSGEDNGETHPALQLHFDSDSDDRPDPEKQLMPSLQTARFVLGRGTIARKRRFVPLSKAVKLPKGGTQPASAASFKYYPYFS